MKKADTIFTTYTVSKVVPLFSCPKLLLVLACIEDTYTHTHIYMGVCACVYVECIYKPWLSVKSVLLSARHNVLSFNLHEDASINVRY